MGRITCAVTGCLSVNTTLSNLSFYRIYAHNRNVRAWIDFCQNPDVTKSSHICSKHFKKTDFMNSMNKSQGILRNTVPSLCPPPTQTNFGIPMEVDEKDVEIPMEVDSVYLDEELDIAGEVEVNVVNDQPQITLSNKKLHNPIRKHVSHDHDYDINVDKVINAMERLVLVEQENCELRKKVRRNQKTMSKHKARIRSLRVEVLELRKSLAQQTQLFDPILLELQKNKLRKQRGARYSTEMKNMAIILHYCSSKAYRQMRKYFTLPSITTIRGWLSKLEVKEGYSKTVLQLLKLRASGLPDDDKLVTIVTDEMSITQRLTYVASAKEDYFMGFPTKVGNEETNTKQRASYALTIMVKSIKSGFKQAIGYFFNASSANSNRLHNILLEGIKLVCWVMSPTPNSNTVWFECECF